MSREDKKIVKYIWLVIIILLGLVIYNFDYWKKKNFFDNIITYNNTDQKVQKDNFNDVVNINTCSPENTPYQAPMATNPSNNFFITDEEKAKWKVASSILDGNEDSLPNTNGSMKNIPQNDIMQINSTLFGPDVNNTDKTNASMNYEYYATVGDYATLDSLGKGLTDTLGGIPTSLGFTLLDEQLGTFKKQSMNNQYTYDNTSNYNTGLNANTVDGNSSSSYGSNLNGKSLQDNKPIFLQKDFDGVSNIFAPNIIIQNPPLTSDGYPDISFQM